MSPEDENFVERLREQYTAPPMTGADVTRFDAQLAARRRKRAQFTWIGGLAAAAVALPPPMTPRRSRRSFRGPRP